jgi:hypothetical protein
VYDNDAMHQMKHLIRLEGRVFSPPSPTRTSLTVGSTRTKILRIFAG